MSFGKEDERLVDEIARKARLAKWSANVFWVCLGIALCASQAVRFSADGYVLVRFDFAVFGIMMTALCSALWFNASIRKNIGRVQRVVVDLIRSRESVVHDVLHDLKSPVAVLLAMAELLERGKISPKEAAARIASCCGRLNDSINANIEISKNYTGEDRPPDSLVNMTELAGEIADDIRLEKRTKEMNVVLKCRFPERDIEIFSNAAKMNSLVSNLIVNAVKYNKPNGEVRVSLWRDRDTVTLRVADTGIGIAKEHIDRIFDRHYRVDHTKGDGNGLGLSHVDSVAKLYGGSVSVDSTPGVGSTFTVTLPIGKG